MKEADQPLVLVYQPGKTGSVMLVQQLQKHLRGVDLRHIHAVADLVPWRDLGKRASEEGDVPATMVKALDDLVSWGEATRNVVDARKALGRQTHIITAIREPLDYGVAALFQNLSLLIPGAVSMHRASPKFVGALLEWFSDVLDRWAADEQARWSGEAFLYRMWDLAERWFQIELEALTGIGVEQLVPRNPGESASAVGEGFRVMAYRFEDLPSVLTRSLPEFLDIPAFRPSSANRTKDKEYADLHQAFRGALRLNAQSVERLHRSLQVRTFYSDAELAASRRRFCVS